MPATVLVGCQWGDEGKGKFVDVLSESFDVVARYQGGNNAGHTVIFDGKKYVLHTLPSGVLRPQVHNVIGNGVVVDLLSLVEELDEVESSGLQVEGRLLISGHAHLILPQHKALDAAVEKASGAAKIGTTLRGIGFAYTDKARRVGLRACDLRNPDRFAAKYRELAAYHAEILTKIFQVEPPDTESTLEELLAAAKRIRPMIGDSVGYLAAELSARKNVLCEGAQGIMLDIDHGTYPYVTSSSPTPGGACVGLGIPPSQIRRVIGIMKAYTTRVGEGPFPTEQLNADGEKLREAGHEFGATTGRPRRCGWLDLPVMRRAIQLAGLTEIIVTKLDVLDGFDEIPVCTHYESADGQTQATPCDSSDLQDSTPIYKNLPGWDAPTEGASTPDALPKQAIEYIRWIERALGPPITMVSTGPDRTATVAMNETLF
ncbi:adenylosuccinate synthase [bacterium]|nr:adenylosuccinate synthase [bacterium]